MRRCAPENPQNHKLEQRERKENPLREDFLWGRGAALKTLAWKICEQTDRLIDREREEFADILQPENCLVLIKFSFANFRICEKDWGLREINFGMAENVFSVLSIKK